jgi:hypothetical protein
MTLIITEFSEELSASFIRVTGSHPDEAEAKFFRNVGSYKSHAA